jgi:hypothetical protein
VTGSSNRVKAWVGDANKNTNKIRAFTTEAWESSIGKSAAHLYEAAKRRIYWVDSPQFAAGIFIDTFS